MKLELLKLCQCEGIFASGIRSCAIRTRSICVSLKCTGPCHEERAYGRRCVSLSELFPFLRDARVCGVHFVSSSNSLVHDGCTITVHCRLKDSLSLSLSLTLFLSLSISRHPLSISWLKSGRHPSLCSFVRKAASTCLSLSVVRLPWSSRLSQLSLAGSFCVRCLRCLCLCGLPLCYVEAH